MTSSNAKRKIIIDTDPGQNDTVAILFALVPVIFLKIRAALTTTAKNVLIQLPSWNEQILRDWVNRSGLPVYAGAPICSSGKTVHYLLSRNNLRKRCTRMPIAKRRTLSLALAATFSRLLIISAVGG